MPRSRSSCGGPVHRAAVNNLNSYISSAGTRFARGPRSTTRVDGLSRDRWRGIRDGFGRAAHRSSRLPRPSNPETIMDMNPVFFRVNDNTIINIGHVIRIEHQKKADG